MDHPNSSYSRRALLWLVITAAVYLLLNGGQIFEAVLIVSAWTAAPPASLTRFQGQYAQDIKTFWITFHSLHEATFVLALVFCWKLPRVRSWLLALLAIHLAVRVWRLADFAPTIIAFQKMPPSATVDPALVHEAARWRNLNVIRVLVFLALNLAFFPLIARVGKMSVLTAGETEKRS